MSYAGKAFLCARSPAGSPRKAWASTCAAAASSPVALHAGFPAERMRCTATTSRSPSSRAALEGRRRPDRRRLDDEIDRLGRPRRRRRRASQDVLVRVTVGRGGAHPRVHRHRPRGPEVRLLAGRRRGDAEAVRRVLARRPTCELVGLHSHIGSQIFDVDGFEVAAHRVIGLLRRRSRDEHGVDAARDSTSAAASASPTSPQRRPADRRATWPTKLRAIVGQRVPRPSASARAAAGRRAGPRDRRARQRHALRGRHRQGRRRRRRLHATLRQRRRRHERQHPHRAVRRRVQRASWPSARLDGAADALPASSASTARAATSWSRDAWLPADVAPGDLLAVAGHRRLLLLDGEQLQPGRRARRWSPCATGGPALILRRETVDDLLTSGSAERETERT